MRDLILVVVAVVLAFAVPNAGSGVARGLRFATRWLRRSTALGCLLVAAFSLLISAGLGLLVHMHEPAIHDEFSYLLAGETYAAGRMTNPTHPLWEHFETFHVLQEPTYQSKYPPGQGLMLAVGNWLGHPLCGVWLSLAAACGAAFWMYRGWMPPGWALLAGFVTAAHYDIFLEWGQTYWGGAVAMFGGGLLLGALPRVLRETRVRDSVCLGLGLAVLANSRPQEGLIVGLCVAAVLGGWLCTPKRPNLAALCLRLALPVAVILLATGAGMAIYNQKVTGDPWRLPYFAYNAQQEGATARHEEIRDYQSSELSFDAGSRGSTASLATLDRRYQFYNRTRNLDRQPYAEGKLIFAFRSFRGHPRTLDVFLYVVRPNGDLVELTPPYAAGKWDGKFVAHVGADVYGDLDLLCEAWDTGKTEPSRAPDELRRAWLFFWKVPLTWPLIALPWLMRRRQGLFWVAVPGVSLTASVLLSTAQTHYLAPVTVLLLGLPVLAARYLGTWRPGGRRCGRFLARAFVVIFVVATFWDLWGRGRLLPGREYVWGLRRAELEERLAAKDVPQLVIVAYGIQHSVHQEWVYNRAEIDAARVVWARDMGAEKNRELVEYFADREILLFSPEDRSGRLVPYSEENLHKLREELARSFREAR